MTRDETMFRERLKGASFSDIAETQSLTGEGVRLAVAREGRKQIDRLHLDLLASHATGDFPAFAIPGHAGPDFDLAMEYVQWAARELSQRGLRVLLHYRPVHNGVVIALEDADPPSNRTKVRNH
jgi:hypothetical protein